MRSPIVIYTGVLDCITFTVAICGCIKVATERIVVFTVDKIFIKQCPTPSGVTVTYAASTNS